MSLLELTAIEEQILQCLNVEPYGEKLLPLIQQYKNILPRVGYSLLKDKSFWASPNARYKIISLLHQTRHYSHAIDLYLLQQELRTQAGEWPNVIAGENFQYLQDFLAQHSHFLAPKIALLSSIEQIGRGLPFEWLKKLLFTNFEGDNNVNNPIPILAEIRELYQKTAKTIEQLAGSAQMKEDDLFYCYQWVDFLDKIIPKEEFLADFYPNYWRYGFDFYQYQLAQNEHFNGGVSELLPIVENIAKIQDIIHNCLAIPYQPISITEISISDFLGVETNKKPILPSYLGKPDAFDKISKLPAENGGLLRILFNQPYGMSYREIDFLSQNGADEWACRSKFLSYFCREGLGLDLSQTITEFMPQFYRMSTEHSSYFDSGKEWWGEYFYAIYQPKRKNIAFILASTTD